VNDLKTELLRRARQSFVSNGVIRTDIAMRLMDLGVCVPMLEDIWGREHG
jgi:hypothetical protein